MSHTTIRLRWTTLLLAGVLVARTALAQDPPDRAASPPPDDAPSTAAAPAPSTTVDRGNRTATSVSIVDPSLVLAIPLVSRPAYMTPMVDPVFGTTVMRIANDTGDPPSPISGSWGADARHTYSKQEPWNSTGTLFSMQNRSGGTPSQLILDGTTYAPRFTPSSSLGLYDYRWHPNRSHPNEMINVNSSGTELSWVDVTTSTKTRSWTLPLTANYGIGSGEGNPSNDGRFVAIGNQTQMVVVDMDPQAPYAPWPNKRIGPVYSFPPCSLGTAGCNIDNISISASGKYVSVKYDNSVDTTRDIQRIYEVDPVTLALKPHNMASSSFRTGSFCARPNGWIFPLKHHDLAVNPYDHNEDVAIGGNSAVDSPLGNVIMVRLRDGQVTELSSPSNEAAFFHTSTRNLDRPGWVYVSYYRQPGKRFSDELVAVKMDGSKTVERLTHLHSVTSGCYRCEQHPVPNRDGTRVIFASNWAGDCGGGCGSASDIKDYVVTTGTIVGVGDGPSPIPGVDPGPTPGAAPDRLALQVLASTPMFGMPNIAYNLPSGAPAKIEMIDVAGRAVMQREVGGGPGRHEMRLGGDRPAAGVYWLRLSQSGAVATSKLVILH